jgi:hypothetical protein
MLQLTSGRSSSRIHEFTVSRSRLQGYHGKVVIDAFDPGLLVSTRVDHVIDFSEAEESELLDIRIPLKLVCRGPTTVHGIACWFDVLFPGSVQQSWLSTAPGMPPTHWFQLRCVFRVRAPPPAVSPSASPSPSARTVLPCVG